MLKQKKKIPCKTGFERERIFLVRNSYNRVGKILRAVKKHHLSKRMFQKTKSLTEAQPSVCGITKDLTATFLLRVLKAAKSPGVSDLGNLVHLLQI